MDGGPYELHRRNHEFVDNAASVSSPQCLLIFHLCILASNFKQLRCEFPYSTIHLNIPRLTHSRLHVQCVSEKVSRNLRKKALLFSFRRKENDRENSSFCIKCRVVNSIDAIFSDTK